MTGPVDDASQPAALGPPEQASLHKAFTQAHQRVMSDASLQFDFPTFEPPTPPAWLEPLLKFFESIAPALGYVFWAGVAIVACLILYAIATAIMRRLPAQEKRKNGPAAPKPTYRPDAVRARALLEDADRLAAQGRFSEAARVLLHRSVEDLEQQLSLTMAPGLTSREIGVLDTLSGDGRRVFSLIARAVEASLFGGRDLDAADYGSCREAYAGFALRRRA